MCADANAVQYAGNAAEFPGRAGVAGEDVDQRQRYLIVHTDDDASDTTEPSDVAATAATLIPSPLTPHHDAVPPLTHPPLEITCV